MKNRLTIQTSFCHGFVKKEIAVQNKKNSQLLDYQVVGSFFYQKKMKNGRKKNPFNDNQ
jgi:hypothetical protein